MTSSVQNLKDALVTAQASAGEPNEGAGIVEQVFDAFFKIISCDQTLALAAACRSHGVRYRPDDQMGSLKAIQQKLQNGKRNERRRRQYKEESISEIHLKRPLYRRMGQIAKNARAHWPEYVGDRQIFRAVVEELHRSRNKSLRAVAGSEEERLALAEAALKWCKDNHVDLHPRIADVFLDELDRQTQIPQEQVA
jgi:hypothetical protein